MLLSHRTRRMRMTASWYRIALDADALTRGERERVKQAFENAHRAAGSPEDVSLWAEPQSDGGVHLFLSPLAVMNEPGLVHRFNAIHCARPRQPLQLLAGRHRMSAGAVGGSSRPASTRTVRGSGLPATYRCRSVRRFKVARACQPHDLAPFVRRWIGAWSAGATSAPTPGSHRR